jgi:hypothetical protein
MGSGAPGERAFLASQALRDRNEVVTRAKPFVVRRKAAPYDDANAQAGAR